MFFGNGLIAVDIGSSAIKLLELSGQGVQRKLKNFAMEVLPRGAIENGSLVDADAVVSALKRCVSKIGAKGRRAAVAVSGNGVVLKKVRITPGKDASVEEQVNFHASQAFQIDLADLYYDFAELGASPVNSIDVEVLLVGARRELIEQYIGLVKSAGLNLGVIEAAPLSLANMFEMNYGVVDGLISMISIGASRTQVSFIESGRYLYGHDIPIGGEAYTSAIMQTLNIARDSAESLKISAAMNPSAVSVDVRKVLDETSQAIVHEIRQIFSFFSGSPDSEGASPLKYTFLTGGASRTLGLDAAIAASLGTPVYGTNPFQKIELNTRKFQLDQMMGLSPFFGVSVGLGFREKGDKVAV
jgi:type IV pilus assembly protein PilM